MHSARDLLELLIAGQDLNDAAATALIHGIISEFEDSQIAAILTALRIKGATGTELAAFARVLRSTMKAPAHEFEHLVDTCGTGGGAPSFNISTAAAILAAAAGAKVAKHGNRAVTSGCGSADVLEALGIRLDADPVRSLERHGVAFLFAPEYHTALRRVAPVRKSLGVRTVFNQLGPLLNPMRAPRQVIGVYDAALLQPMSQAAFLLGTELTWVVHSEDGLDEVSPCATAVAYRASASKHEGPFGLHPEEYDFALQPEKCLTPGRSVQESAEILVESLSDPGSLRCLAVLPSAALTLWCAGIAEDLKDGLERAHDAVESGRASELLRALISGNDR